MKVSRRKLAQILTATAALAADPACAQVPSSAAKPTPDEDLARARAALRSNAETIAKMRIPVTVEPAFRFKA